MTTGKRILDLVVTLTAAVVLVPLGLMAALAIVLIDGRPVLYRSERIGQDGRPFVLWKLRTMRPPPAGRDGGVSGGDKADRVTRTGAVLRRFRLDEIPQLWNVLRGEMSLVGPRPPLRQYVERFPDLYAQVLKSRPGITGLATLVFRRREEALLAACSTPEQTDRVYATRCIPRKARLDLIYQKRASPCLDLWILTMTLLQLLDRESAR